MPNVKSAEKRMRQNSERRLLNRSRRSAMRTEIKRIRGLIDSGDLDQARSILPSVYSAIDKNVKKGVVHANTAARYKSRLAKKLV